MAQCILSLEIRFYIVVKMVQSISSPEMRVTHLIESLNLETRVAQYILLLQTRFYIVVKMVQSILSPETRVTHCVLSLNSETRVV